MFPMSSDYSALSSAVEDNGPVGGLPSGSDVTMCSQNSRSSLSDDTMSEPASPETSEKDNDSNKTDSTKSKSPGLSYIALISMAIQSSPEKRMLLSEIYQWISERYPYYNMKEKSWRNSIRHNLSLNECFVKNGRSENGKGNYWSIHPANIEDFARGDYRRRRARRRVRKCDEDLRRLCTRSPYPSPSPPSSEPPCAVATPSEGYVPMMSTPVTTNYLTSLGLDNKNRDDWNYHNVPYYAANYHKSRDMSFYPGESCSQLYNYQQPDTYGGMYAQGTNKHSVAKPTSPTGEFSVNVNVNVYGNTTTSRQYPSPSSPSYYYPSSAQAPKGVLQGYAYADPVNDFSYNGVVSGGVVSGGSDCAFSTHGQGGTGGCMDKMVEDKEKQQF